jgi:hypothetical protein
MMIFKKAIPRRTILRGMGAALALPLLDGMVPAFAGPVGAVTKPVTRVGFVYVPNGRIMEKWTPATEGAGFDFPEILEPLAPFRDHLLVLSGLSTGIPPTNDTDLPPGQHAIAGASFLTGVYPRKSTVKAGISVDQIIAKEFGKVTQLASLEMGLDSDIIGACDGGACAYTNTLSWRTPTTPLMMENSPRVIFERLFGDGNSTDPKERLAQIRRRDSILQTVTEATNQLMGRLGPSDRGKLSEYLDSVHDIERRIQLAEEQSSRELPQLDKPPGIPATFEAHSKLMFDLQLLAYQADLTRVITFSMGHESTGRTYGEIGIPDPHHPLSHHAGDPERISKVTKIDIYQSKMFAYYLEKLKATPDGDGTLLDHVMIVYGGGLSDGNLHLHNNLPLLLVGGGAGKINSGRHIMYPKEKETPTANLYLTLLDKLEMPVEHFGISTGELNLLSV